MAVGAFSLLHSHFPLDFFALCSAMSGLPVVQAIVLPSRSLVKALEALGGPSDPSATVTEFSPERC